ncbi:MAG TPA: DNA gyrase C-terminal beta-propeller domain-containing protein, partial [Bacteroidales bacterium]|nr:DNA gyrase C-terminal beta-propeller domain-containing protein [Bacteroidales bacterium]
RVTNRGGKGVKTINVTEKTGKLVAAMSVKDGDELMIINVSGIAIRMSVSDLRVVGRATQGVKLINLSGKDSIASVAKIASDFVDNESEDIVDENGQEPTANESSDTTDETQE